MSGLRPRLPWIWTGLVTGISLLFALTWGTNPDFPSAISAISWMMLPILYTALGALIVSRSPGNRIAWILFVVGAAILLDGASQPFIAEEPLNPDTLDYVALFFANTMWIVVFFPLFILLYIFPTGHFLTRRWRWAGWLAGGMVAVFCVQGLFLEAWGNPNDTWELKNPIGFIPASIWDTGFGVVWSIGLVALPLGGLVAMTVRFRRSDAVERAQVKWVLYATLVLALTYITSVVTVELGGGFGDLLIGNLFVMGLVLLPISITVAIMRYRLFEIDRIISRTLAYALVVLVLGALYVGLVTLTSSLLPTQNALAVAGSTLGVAALFNPVRVRIQRAVDHRFNRSRYEADIVASEFASTLQSSHTTDELVQAWTNTVNDFMQPSTSGIWVRSN